MKLAYHAILIIFLFISCQQEKHSVAGRYELEIGEMKNIERGELEIVGEPGDYFGRIIFFSKRERSFEIGLKDSSYDSLKFILPGGGGFLNLKMKDSALSGKFKYFGLRAELSGRKIGPPSNELQALVDLKPIGNGIISTDEEEAFPSYDAKNQILYFSRNQRIFSSQLNDSGWEKPVHLDFSDEFNDSAPYIFNDGESLLFTSNRQVDDSQPKKKNLWVVNRTKNGWSKPIPLPGPVNIDSLGDYHGAISLADNIYFVSYNRTGGYGRSDIYVATKSSDDTYAIANIGNAINSNKSEADVYVDPAEKYLLFASTGRADGYGADDIYISFKEGVDWSAPRNLGPKVNSYAYEYGVWVDQSNGYLYFNSYRRGTSDIYKIKLEELDVFDK